MCLLCTNGHTPTGIRYMPIFGNRYSSITGNYEVVDRYTMYCNCEYGQFLENKEKLIKSINPQHKIPHKENIHT